MTLLSIQPGAFAQSVAQVHPAFRWAWQARFMAVPLSGSRALYPVGTHIIYPSWASVQATPTAWEFGEGMDFHATNDDAIEFGDSAARGGAYAFHTQGSERWGVAVLWTQRTTTGDERCTVSAWGNTGYRQMELHTANEAAPAQLNLSMNSDAYVASIASAIYTDTPYFAVGWCEGDEVARLRLYDPLAGRLLGSAQATVVADAATDMGLDIGDKAPANADPMDGVIGVVYLWDGYFPTVAQQDQLARDPFGPVRLYRRIPIMVPVEEAITAALTGTIVSSTTESDIVSGGKTIILTLSGGTWIADRT